MGKKEIKIDKAIIFSCIPILGAFYSYVYERSYGDYFNIPIELISIDLFSSLLNPVLIVVMASILYVSFKFCFSYMPNRILRNCICFAVSLIAFAIIVNWAWSLIVVALITFLLFDFIIWIFDSNQEKQENKVIASVGEIKFWKDSLFYMKNKNIKPLNVIVLIVIVLIGMNICEVMGKNIASRKDKFLVTRNSNQTLVVLKVYNDKAICSPINDKEHTIGSSFFIIDIKRDPDREFILKQIGPIKFKR